MSMEEADRHRGDALWAVQKAKQHLNLLLAEVRQFGNRYSHVAKLMRELELSDSFLSGPAVSLLHLPEMEYSNALNLAAIKAIANSVILARKQVKEALQKAHDLGVGE